jgi:RHS repeat-associated protein
MFSPSRNTAQERDQETGLDYFGARYFSGAQGRFTSPDEVFADQDECNPQSWNLYNYVRNNPLRYTDRDGRACTYDQKTNNFTGDCASPGLLAHISP